MTKLNDKNNETKLETKIALISITPYVDEKRFEL